MNKKLQLSLVLAAFAFCLAGCQKEETTPAAGASPAANAAASGAGEAPAAPRQNLPPAAVEQMTKSLNDPNTPPAVKAQLRQQLGQK